MRITILGSGTSTGVPMIGCHCPVCSSDDPHDHRSRCSIVVHYQNRHILVDTTPELRLQAITARLDRIDAVVFTHAHADHIFGLDDLRRYNTILGSTLPVYAAADTLAALKRVFPYAFSRQQDEGFFRPALAANEIDGSFDLFGVSWRPIPLRHARGAVLGFRIGDFAYCTDCSEIPESSLEQLRNLQTLVIDALRPRPHPAHLSFAQALALIARLQPQRAYFTHLSHDVSHAQAEADLPPHVRLCYDGLTIPIPGE